MLLFQLILVLILVLMINVTCGIAAIKSPRISPDCIILDKLVFENVILAGEPFAKALRFFQTCVSVKNNLCEN